MNTKFLNALVVLFLIGTIACSKLTVTKINKIKQISHIKTPLGKTIVDTVQLQLRTGGAVDSIIELLEGLVDDLDSQQEDADADSNTQNSNWDDLEAQYSSQIDYLNARVIDIESSIDQSNQDISSTERNIRVLKDQLALVAQKISDLNEARSVDEDATESRVARQSSILQAVNTIIDDLETLLEANSFVQLAQIKKTLQKLVKANPIQALVQLTMTFQPDAVNYAVKKLGELRDALVASLQDEDAQEDAAAAQYKDLLNELEDFQSQSQADLDDENADLAEERQDLKDEQDDLERTQDLLSNVEDLLQRTHDAQDAYNQKYNADKAERAYEVDIIEQVVDILSEDSDITNAAEANKFTSD